MTTLSIRTQLLAFGLAAAAGAMALALAITVALPPPKAGRTNVAEMAWALQGRPSSVIGTGRRSSPPTGRRSELLERAIATASGLPRGRIRAAWRDLPDGSGGRGQSVLRIGDRDAVVDTTGSGFRLRYGEGAELRSRTLVPLFNGAVRLSDGSWLWAIPDDEARSAWTRRIAASFLLGLCLILPMSAYVAARLARPIKLLGQAAEAAAFSDPDPFPSSGPAEVRATAYAMNAMHRRLREQAAERILMLGGLAHDLRTPLTAMRLRAEALPRRARAAVREDLDRMSELVETMVGGTPIGAYAPVATEIDLAAFARECGGVIARAGGRVCFGRSATSVVRTDPILARRLMVNLIDNASRHGGGATVRTASTANGGIVEIADDGPGMPEDRLLGSKRSSRIQSRSDGSGLGLSIVHDLALTLHVEIEMTNTDHGFLVTLRFPPTIPHRPWQRRT